MWYEKKKLKENKTLSGYNMYVSHTTNRLKSLDPLELRMTMMGVNDEPDEEDEVHDSIFKYVGTRWKLIDDEVKNAWNVRAKKFNSLERNRPFEKIPHSIIGNLEMMIKESLLLDWARLKKTLKRSIMHPPGRDFGEAVFDMPDNFQLLSQSYRRYQLNHMMQMTIFGEKFKNLEPEEIIRNFENVTYVHIASGRRMSDLMEVDGDVACEYVDEENDLHYQAVGKVNVIKNGKNIIGYIVDETLGGKWEILLRNNETVYLHPVLYFIPELNETDFLSESSDQNEGYVFNIDAPDVWNITEYWPIRMKFTRNAIENWQYSLSRLVVNCNGEVNEHLSS